MISEGNRWALACWDFGGQEIYHATHRLFFADDSIYLLVWAEETEEELSERNMPLDYWLDIIEDLAPDSKIQIIKNQVDKLTSDIENLQKK